MFFKRHQIKNENFFSVSKIKNIHINHNNVYDKLCYTFSLYCSYNTLHTTHKNKLYDMVNINYTNSIYFCTRREIFSIFPYFD